MDTFSIPAEPPAPDMAEWKFIEELSAPVSYHFAWTRRTPNANEAALGDGIRLLSGFPDPDGILDTAYRDFERFAALAGLRTDGGYQVITAPITTGQWESYRITVSPSCCRIEAGDPEGIRRAVYHLEDLLLAADGPFLPCGVIQRRPWLKSRISRCFFGPIKRPPFNRDELLDDLDYYPDAYLDRLAHEGTNGLWLTVEFKDLCRTAFTTPDADMEKRLEKLRRTVQKCLRYGIKTYLFAIEPRALPAGSPLLSAHPELKGPQSWNGNFCFCPFSDTAREYLYRAVNSIFARTPGLGGMINISYGERPTSCASADFGKDCPVCSRKSPGEILAATLRPMEQGMHAAAPDAELISWLYVPENYTGTNHSIGEMLDIADKTPENVILQYNFESGGSKEQLGKKRHAGDYWLSYVGPSEKYTAIGRRAMAAGREISAKIQVGCSHEVATVPLVPVPGLLYRKYRAMRELGVSRVMQCWYFGNYPGVMTKAAGELAFEEFTDSEQDFLRRLAQVQWLQSTEDVVKAWTHFADAYGNYPLENMFQYYGPMHDGIVWPLHLQPADLPLAPTWRLDYGTSGDRYGECLGSFSLAEASALCAELSQKWHRGTELMRQLRQKFAASQAALKDIMLAEALDIQFNSGLNILRFYGLRDRLAETADDAGLGLLDAMQTLLEQEIANTEAMLDLCRQDSRLGFHSEAEGYKYFPAKLAWRRDLLRKLLTTEFAEVRRRLLAGQRAFAPEDGKTYICNCGKYEDAGDFSWRADYAGGELKIRVEDTCGNPAGLMVMLEPKPFFPPRFFPLATNELRIKLDHDLPEIYFNIFRAGAPGSSAKCRGWIDFTPRKSRLVLGDYEPRAKGKLILNQA